MSSSAVRGIKDCFASYLADEDVRVAGAVNRSFRQATEDRRLALDIRPGCAAGL